MNNESEHAGGTQHGVAKVICLGVEEQAKRGTRTEVVEAMVRAGSGLSNNKSDRHLLGLMPERAFEQPFPED